MSTKRLCIRSIALGRDENIEPHRQITLPAQPESLSVLHHTLKEFEQWIARSSDPPPGRFVLDTLHVAVMEIAANSVEHACAATLSIEMVLRPGQVELTLCDDGRPFNPAILLWRRLPDPWTQGAADRWGLGLAKQALDDLSYRRREGINEWRLVKRLAPI